MSDIRCPPLEFILSTVATREKQIAEVVEKMYIMLDLLISGYELTEVDWYREKHTDLYPEESEEDLW